MPNSNAGSRATSTVRLRVVAAPVAAAVSVPTCPDPAARVAVTCRVNGIKVATMPWAGPAPTISHDPPGFGAFVQGWPLVLVAGQLICGVPVGLPYLM